MIIKLKPYNSFDEVEFEAFNFYSKINKFLVEKNVSRIAVRYINEINYKQNYIHLFENNPVNNFYANINGLTRLYNQSFFEHSINNFSNLQVVLDLKNQLTIIDIDSYHNKSYKSNEIVEIKKVLKILRNIKNSIFFQIVSEKLEEAL